MSIFNYLSIGISFLAIVVSVAGVMISRRSLINTAITSNRIEWINDVRSLVQAYTGSYLKGDFSEKKLAETNILLYLRHDVKIYKPLIEALEICTADEAVNYANLSKLVVATQDTLNDVWNRMKREAGISRRSEQRLKKKLRDEKKRP